jgi:Ran-binding protein 9/10
VFDGIGKDCDVYPSIGLRHQTEAVRANFGQDPFQYDIEDHVHQRRNQVWTTIQNTAIDSNVLQCIIEGGGTDLVFGVQSSSAAAAKNASTASIANDGIALSPSPGVPKNDSETLGKKTRSTMDKLVLSYLTHHGYAKTARAFERQCEGGHINSPNETSRSPGSRLPSVISSPAPDDIDLRTKIVKHVVAGDIDAALEATAVNYPGVLEKEQALMLFKLRCRKFIELLLGAATSLKRVKMEAEEEADDTTNPIRVRSGRHAVDGDIEIDGMDIDEDAFRPSHSLTNQTNGFLKPADVSVRAYGKRRPSTGSTNAAQSALQDALNYGRQLEMDYKSDSRPEVKTYLNRTFSVVAYEDPLAVGGDVGEIAGQEAREILATELNKAILGTFFALRSSL